MLTTLRTAPRLTLQARAFATAAEIERGQISRTVDRTRFAKRVDHGKGPIIHAALRPKDKQSPFLVCVPSDFYLAYVLSDFRLDYATMPRDTGFPDHPHRGLTTVTQVRKGKWAHEDFLGNCGTLQPGEVQWMTTGRGIMHCEMPEFDGPDAPDPVALQLWVDMPSANKMDKPSYQGLKKDE